jgi:CrcB protein
MNSLLLVALGGGIGAALRHVSSQVMLRSFGAGFPWGTFFVNVAGSLIMGVFIAWLVKRGGSNDLRLFFATGVLGGFTTFSAFSLDMANLIERGALMSAFSYAAGSLLLCVASVFIGLWFGRAFL